MGGGEIGRLYVCISKKYYSSLLTSGALGRRFLVRVKMGLQASDRMMTSQVADVMCDR